MQVLELKVDGMSCGSCVSSVTRALRRVPGVQDVEVDLSSGIARVRGEQAASQVAQLVAALAEAGYTAGAAHHQPVSSRHPVGGCGAGAGTPAKGRGSCCCG